MSRYDVVGVGNAIVDVLSQCDDAFLDQTGVEKGIMTLIDQDRAKSLYGAMPAAQEISGGSAANTAAGAAAIGAKTGFLGRIKDDQLGQIFMHDIRAIGVEFDGPLLAAGPETSRCLVLVSPDGERSMSTYLGASIGLNATDIDIDLLGRADWLYLEGYLFDTHEAKEAYARAIAATKAGGGKTSVTLSDPAYL
ncbi:MAG: adenosine kinase, partial [Pseudomonadota bacterium]